MIIINSMSEIYKFPNGGYEVVVLKRQDVLDCIDANIIDKEIAFAIVAQCELDAANFIREGRWTGLPYIGNVRIPKAKLMEEDSEQQALINEAKEFLDPKQYILFRKRLSADNHRKAKFERYFKYITSIGINKNKILYKKLCKLYGENYSKIYIYSITNLAPIGMEYVMKENE